MTFIIEDEHSADKDGLINRNHDYGCNRDPQKIQSDGEKIRSRKNGVSIDVTKALVLLGFDSWSSLEPGNFQIHSFRFVSVPQIYTLIL